MTAILLALAVLLPVWAWSPFVLDDPRLDGGLLGLVAAAAVVAARLPRLPRGGGWILAALALGALPLAVLPVPPCWGGLADRAPWLAALALASVAAARPAALARAWPWILGGVFAAAGYGLLQRAGLDPLAWRPAPDSPPTAPLAGTNHAAELLLLALVTVVVWPGGAARSRGWLLAALPVALQAGWLGVSAFRLGFPLGLAWAVARDRKRAGAAAALLAAALAGEGARLAWPEPPAPLPATAAPAAAAPDWTSWQVRWRTLLDVVPKAAATPLGIGLGRFELDYPHWRSAESLRLASRDFSDPATPQPKDPHNEPLLLAIECGWLGLLLGAAGVLRLLRRPERASWTGAPLLALAVPLLVRAPLSDDPAALACAALLAGATASNGAGARAGAPRAGPSRWLVLGAALAAAAAAPFQLGGELGVAGRNRAEDTILALRAAEPDPAPGSPAAAELAAARERRVLALERALAWRPWDAAAWDLLAQARAEAGRAAAPIRGALESALRHDPADLFALTSLFQIELLEGRPAAARALLERAERLAALHPSVREARRLCEEDLPANALRLLDEGATREAAAALAAAEAIAPAHPAVRSARTAFLEREARTWRDAATAAFQRIASGDAEATALATMRHSFLSSHLFTALVEIRRGEVDACRNTLATAATYADDHRALVVRTARRPDLDEALVRELMLRIDAALAPRLGPAPPGTAAEG